MLAKSKKTDFFIFQMNGCFAIACTAPKRLMAKDISGNSPVKKWLHNWILYSVGFVCKFMDELGIYKVSVCFSTLYWLIIPFFFVCVY